MPNPSAPRNNGHQQTPDVRKHNFEEVAQSFTDEEAQAEAQRCLHCKNARCQANCPVGYKFRILLLM